MADPITYEPTDPRYMQSLQAAQQEKPATPPGMMDRIGALAEMTTMGNPAKGMATLGGGIPYQALLRAIKSTFQPSSFETTNLGNLVHKMTNAGPKAFERVLNRFPDNATPEPLSAGTDFAAVRIGDEVLKLSPKVQRAQYYLDNVAKIPSRLVVPVKDAENIAGQVMAVTQPRAIPMLHPQDKMSENYRLVTRALEDYFQKALRNTDFGTFDIRPENVGRMPDEAFWRTFDLGALLPIDEIERIRKGWHRGQVMDRTPAQAVEPPLRTTDQTIQWGQKRGKER